jgi:putative transposase
LVDTLGLLLVVLVHSAGIQDRDGARLLVRRAKGTKRWPRLRVVFADGGYAGRLVGWVWECWRVALRVIKRSDRARGFEVLPKRWIVERTFGWLGDYRRLSKDYEFHEHTSETMVYLAMTHLMLKRLAPATGRPSPR